MPINAEKARIFRDLHIKSTPLILWNIWDAGSAKALAATGVPAMATGSYALAGALGYGDSEACPRAQVLNTLTLICQATDRPITHDAERGYGATPEAVGDYVAEIVEAGAVGINLEVGLASGGLRDAATQADRIQAAKQALGVGFLNARTDVFFDEAPRAENEKVEEVVARAGLYAEAGADGLFVPGLLALETITELVERVRLPLNIMRPLDGPTLSDLAACGVSRISHGPFPWLHAMASLETSVAPPS